jgi:hypothetical protein
MLTATLAFALLGGFSPGANATLPNLQTDYAQARSVASADNKPIAVFIGRGTDAMGRMLADGSIPADAAQLLRDRYVALYIDTDTAAGKELAGRFAVSTGLVISGPGGSVQAFRHSGTLSGPALTRQLGQYAAAGQPTTTVTTGATAAPSSSGVVIPAAGQYVVPQYAFPAGGYAYPSFGGFGPTCAPGRH